MANVLRIFCSFAVIWVAGCTSASITPELESKPTERYANVAIGDVSMEGNTWKHLLPHLREGMVARFGEEKTYQKVIPTIEGDLPASTLIVNVVITKVDEGSTAARFLIGFGAGSAEVAGKFTLQDTSRIPVVSFSAEEQYAGGAGIGGLDMVRMEELMKKLGQSAASSIIRWSQGKGLKDPDEG